jgi:hypothetical protein
MQTAIVAPSPGSRATVEGVVSDMTTELDAVADELVEAIHDNVGVLDDDQRSGTWQSTRSNLGMIMAMLAEGTSPLVATPPREALAYARGFVRRGLGLEVLQRTYRTGQACLSRRWLSALHDQVADADELTETFGFMNEWLFAWVDALECRLTEYYTREREQWMRGTMAMRAEEVRAILEGRSVDVASASAKLRYALDRTHVGFVVWAPDATPEPGDGNTLFASMESLAAEVSKLLGGIDHLTVPLGPHLACWTGFRGRPDCESLPERLPAAAAAGLSVAVGDVGEGIDGFRRTYVEAARVRRVVALTEPGVGVCRRFPPLALEALLTDDVEEARRFVQRELGALCDQSANACRLRGTLSTFLDENCSFRHAAQQLGVHENTIGYRVRRAEELLGHDVRSHQLELRTALRLARFTL